jgi:hypothetical protein
MLASNTHGERSDYPEHSMRKKAPQITVHVGHRVVVVVVLVAVTVVLVSVSVNVVEVTVVVVLVQFGGSISQHSGTAPHPLRHEIGQSTKNHRHADTATTTVHVLTCAY